ncbi:hypothetical protein L596_003560 [Steinernema carpocapsae]|uniref:Uncharacterized protein n=1 Tax=Steinernema carpocapsae TaxID=34508 RepID=A0A4U8UUL2_STECR|nr:hypothetical protein L596_003560 [Steinernema carpocapsae]
MPRPRTRATAAATAKTAALTPQPSPQMAPQTSPHVYVAKALILDLSLILLVCCLRFAAPPTHVPLLRTWCSPESIYLLSA